MSNSLLLALARLADGEWLGLFFPWPAVVGLSPPPLGACVRTPFGAILPDRAAVQAAYALDASAEELTWISGPPLALGIGMLWSTGAALAIGGGVLLLGTVIFAAQPGLSRLESQP